MDISTGQSNALATAADWPWFPLKKGYLIILYWCILVQSLVIVAVAISCYIPVICGSIQDFVTYIDSQSFTVYIVFYYYWLESSFGGCRSNILVFWWTFFHLLLFKPHCLLVVFPLATPAMLCCVNRHFLRVKVTCVVVRVYHTTIIDIPLHHPTYPKKSLVFFQMLRDRWFPQHFG